MPDVKIAVLGAGSFVFGPSVVRGAIVEHRLDGVELALVDPNRSLIDPMAAAAEATARRLGVDVKVATHSDRRAALDGAEYVICSVARELHRRFEIDCRIAAEHAPGHMISEFGGIAGISYSLRQMAMIQEVAADMRRLCPRAWLLNVANPLPRVSQAAHEAGIRTIGFCSASLLAFQTIWKILRGQDTGDYPFEPAVSAMQVTMAGLNHITWVLELRDAATGQDLLPELRRRVAGGASAGQPMSQRLLRQTGYLPAAGDAHIRDFFPPRGEVPSRAAPGHGSAAEREMRLRTYADIAAGRVRWEDAIPHGSWEKPVDLIAARMADRRVRFHALNLPNSGQMRQLPADVFVETPCEVCGQQISPANITLPETVLPYMQHTALVTETLVRAARLRSRALVHAAVDLDPTIIDKAAGQRAIDACMAAHADVLPEFE